MMKLTRPDPRYRRHRWATALALVALLAAAPAAAQGFFGSSSNKDGELAVRLGQIEEQMRHLTGQIEELNHQLRQTQDQLRRSQEDNEFRFQELEGGPGKRSDSRGTAPGGQTAGVAPAGTNPPAGEDQFARERAATVRPLGSFNLPADGPSAVGVPGQAGGQPLDLSMLARGAARDALQPDNPDPGPPGVAPGDDAIGQLVLAPSSGSARDDYDRAYNQVLRGEYDQAAAGLSRFLDEHPDDPLAANAQYWLGESYYGQGLYREAADAFLKTYTDYPSNEKAPDSLLKLGLSLGGLGQKDAACATYSELLGKYPNAARAVLNQARAEQKSAGCRG